MSTVSGVSAAHAVDECHGRNLLNELAGRNAAAYERILKSATSAPNAEAMTWRIEAKDGASSFLFGTVHVADPRLQQLPGNAKDALSAAKVVVLERAIASEQAVRSVMPLAARLMMDQSRSLDSVLNEDELATLKAAVGGAGLAPELARAFRPWAATLFLASSKCEEQRQKSGLVPLDLIVANAASSLGTTIVGLETVVEQYEALATVPEDVQVAWLKSSIALHDRIDDMSETTVALYLDRRIEAVWELSAELSSGSGMTADTARRLREALVDRRNKRMAERLQPIIEKGGAFIAIGASHLPGDQGLVALLRQQGWRLSPLE